MSARRPITLPAVSVLPLMTPTTPVRPIPVTTSSQPKAFSFSSTTPAVRTVSNRISGFSCRSRRHSVISGSSSAKRFLTGILSVLVPAAYAAGIRRSTTSANQLHPTGMALSSNS